MNPGLVKPVPAVARVSDERYGRPACGGPNGNQPNGVGTVNPPHAHARVRARRRITDPAVPKASPRPSHTGAWPGGPVTGSVAGPANPVGAAEGAASGLTVELGRVDVVVAVLPDPVVVVVELDDVELDEVELEPGPEVEVVELEEPDGEVVVDVDDGTEVDVVEVDDAEVEVEEVVEAVWPVAKLIVAKAFRALKSCGLASTAKVQG